jgi:hypothetical protein
MIFQPTKKKKTKNEGNYSCIAPTQVVHSKIQTTTGSQRDREKAEKQNAEEGRGLMSIFLWLCFFGWIIESSRGRLIHFRLGHCFCGDADRVWARVELLRAASCITHLFQLL